MSEFSSRLKAPLIAAVLVGIAAMAGCTTEKAGAQDPYSYTYSNEQPNWTVDPTPTPHPTLYPQGPAASGLVPCFDTTISQPKRVERPEMWNFITLQKDEQTGDAVGDPGPLPPKVLNHVLGAIVEIDNESRSSGSGFLVKPNVVVTAAHVPDSPNATVRDHAGREAHILDGCYIRQTEETPVAQGGTRMTDVDIAVLRLDRSIGTTTLELAGGVQRGEWETMVNSQGASDPEHPSAYNGIYLSGDTDVAGAAVLTGISSRGSKDPKTYVALPGCSGGVGVNRKGQVTLMTTGSYRDPFNPDNNTIHALGSDYGVMTPGDGINDLPKGWFPNPATVMSIATIQKALSSRHY